MSIDPADYCEVCGEDMVVVLGDQPLCLSHFSAALKRTKEAIAAAFEDDRRSNE